MAPKAGRCLSIVSLQDFLRPPQTTVYRPVGAPDAPHAIVPMLYMYVKATHRLRHNEAKGLRLAHGLPQRIRTTTAPLPPTPWRSPAFGLGAARYPARSSSNRKAAAKRPPRTHTDLKAETTRPSHSLVAQQRNQCFREEFNHERPHEARHADPGLPLPAFNPRCPQDPYQYPTGF